jgi:type I restriction enzyme S subunit
MAGWNVSREVAVVPVDRNRLDPEFAAFWIGATRSQDWLGKVKKGAAYTGINIEDLRDLPVPLPSLGLQRQTVEALRSAQNATRQLASIHSRRLSALHELKSALLHQAFTARLSAKSIDKQLAEVA